MSPTVHADGHSSERKCPGISGAAQERIPLLQQNTRIMPVGKQLAFYSYVNLAVARQSVSLIKRIHRAWNASGNT